MSQPLGDKIKKIREFRKITLEELARKTGYSVEFLSGLEDGSKMTTLGTLMVIAKGMGLRVGTFLDDSDRQGPAVSRKAERGEGVRFSARTDSGTGDLSFLPLAHDQGGRHMEPFIIDIAASTAENFQLSQHEGEEFIYVLSGTVEVSYGKETYVLEEGDTIYYDSIVPHSVHSARGTDSRILAVVYTA